MVDVRDAMCDAGSDSHHGMPVGKGAGCVVGVAVGEVTVAGDKSRHEKGVLGELG